MLRLKSRRQFQAVLAGSTLARTTHFALHCVAIAMPDPVQNEAPLFSSREAWLGAMVPKRWAKRAVTRNTIKRQIYAVCASFETVLKPAAHVVRMRCGFDTKQYVSASSIVLKTAVRTELQQLLAQATDRFASKLECVS